MDQGDPHRDHVEPAGEVRRYPDRLLEEEPAVLIQPAPDVGGQLQGVWLAQDATPGVTQGRVAGSPEPRRRPILAVRATADSEVEPAVRGPRLERPRLQPLAKFGRGDPDQGREPV